MEEEEEEAGEEEEGNEDVHDEEEEETTEDESTEEQVCAECGAKPGDDTESSTSEEVCFQQNHYITSYRNELNYTHSRVREKRKVKPRLATENIRGPETQQK